MTEIRCLCGRIAPPIAVQAAVEIETNLRCSPPSGCGMVIPHATLVSLCAKPLSRKCHPDTSAEAAKSMVGKVRESQIRALRFVKENPGKTANELASIAGDRDPRTIGRRLGELAKMGLITRETPRVCSMTRRVATVWSPITGV